MIKRLNDYMAEEAEDFEIDRNHLTACLMRLPNLHSKWMRRLIDEQGRYLRMEDARRKMFRRKHELYHTGRTRDGKETFDLEVRPNHLIWYIEADAEYSALLLKVDIQKKVVKYCEAVLDKVKNQNYVLRNIIEWERYKAGA